MLDKVHRLHFWCQKVLPLVYDDSLSYYELLCKVVKYLNDHIELINTLIDFYNDFSTDVEEIIHEMFINGELNPAIVDALSPIIADEYDPTKEYSEGDYALKDGVLYKANKDTTGEWNPSDWDETKIGDSLTYIENYLADLNAGNVVYNNGDTYPEDSVGEALNYVFENFESVYINIKKRGAVGDGVTDDTQAIQNTINEACQNNKRVFIPSGNFLITSPLVIPAKTYNENDLIIEGMGFSSHIFKNQASTYNDVDTIIYSGTSNLKKIYNIKLTNSVTNGYDIYCDNIEGVLLQSLWLYGYYGIYLYGWVCYTRDIFAHTSHRCYYDRGTTNGVENFFASYAENPFRFASSCGSYKNIAAENCTGTILTFNCFTGAHITTMSIESPNADNLITVETSSDSVGNLTIDKLAYQRLADGKKLFIVPNGNIIVDTLIAWASSGNTDKNIIADFANSTRGNVIINYLFALNFNNDQFTYAVNKTSRNNIKIGTVHNNSNQVISAATGEVLAYTFGHTLNEDNVIGIPLGVNEGPSIVIGGVVDGTDHMVGYSSRSGTSMRYSPNAQDGSLFVNDLSKDTAKGVAGFIKVGAGDNVTVKAKAPIPIFVMSTKGNISDTPYILKRGILWFDLDTNKFKIRGTNGWYAIQTTFEADS